MHRVLSRALVCVVLTVSAFGPTLASGAGEPIRPGAFMDSPAGCTLNFVFEDDTDRYIGTAGHCTGQVGDRVSTPETGPFGTVVFRAHAGWDDFALIRIDPEMHDRVGTALEVFGTPTGSTTRDETLTGDPIGLEGNGILLGSTAATRSRVGLFAYDSDQRFVAEIPAIFGDSGGPLVHLATGKALGVVSGITVTVPPSTLYGTTIERALQLTAAAGLPVRLVTA
jgi:hypothetical protein